MEKHILVCVSDDVAASYTLRFVRGFFDAPCKVHMTLLFVAPKTGSWEGGAARNKGREVLEKARDWFESMSFCEGSKIELKTLSSHGNAAKMIVQEGHKGLYDAVLIGRKDSSIFEELFDYSISHRILWEEVGFPLWFCRCPQEELRSGVLLCVEDDEPSLRMADHVGFILNDNKKHDVTLFYVDSGSGTDAEAAFARAREALAANGVEESRIKQLTVKNRNVFKAIREQSEKGQYAVVAVGRGQHRKSAKEAVLPESISVKLLRSSDPSTLWISK